MSNLPQRLSGTGKLARASNGLIDFGRSLRPLESNDTLLEHGPLGTIRRARKSISGSSIETPFEIYQSGSWLEFKVKVGYVIMNGEPVISVGGVETLFTLTSGVTRYWFLITLTVGAATISISPTVPAWSATVIPIGWVDTDTHSAESASTIYQFVHDNIFSPCIT